MPSSTSEQFAHLVQPEHLDTIDVLGPTIQFLTSPTETNAPCIMRGTIPPGMVIPLHSHGDPETFVMLSGVVDGLLNGTATGMQRQRRTHASASPQSSSIAPELTPKDLRRIAPVAIHWHSSAHGAHENDDKEAVT